MKREEIDKYRETATESTRERERERERKKKEKKNIANNLIFKIPTTCLCSV